jgi:hypothetical protein
MPKCKLCGEQFIRQYSLKQNCCSIEHTLQYLRQKEKKTTAKLQRKEQTELREKLKTYSQKLNEAKKVFQKWIRIRDADKPCISCGTTVSIPFWDGGHYKKAELYRGVIFDEDNVHKQCRKCNFYLDGNELNYRRGLIDRIGKDKVEELEERAEQTKKEKYSDEFLKSIKTKYKC